MMIRNTTLIALCCLLAASCTHYYYGPNSNNTPLLKENEAKINFQLATADEFNALEVQSAFATSPHTGIMANFITGGGTEDNSFSTDNDESGNAHLIEFGVGYFSPLKKSGWIFETFGGLGLGAINNRHSGSERSHVKIKKLFIQPDIGYRNKGFEFGFSSRFTYAKHTLDISTVSSDSPDYQEIQYLQQHPSSFLWEPGVVLRFGGKNFLFQVQQTFSVNITNPDLKQELGIFNLGLCLPIHYRTVGK